MGYQGEKQLAIAATSDSNEDAKTSNSINEEGSKVIVYQRRNRNKQVVVATSPSRKRKHTCSDERPKTEPEPMKDLTLAEIEAQAIQSSGERPKTEPKPKKVLTLAEIKAYEIRSRLNDDANTAVLLMRMSHVRRVFWLHLPTAFCRSAKLPEDKDTSFTLVGELVGKTHTSKYLIDQKALSAGWVGFAKSHKLCVGDALVFHRVGESIFMVYIVRAQDFMISATESSLSEGRGNTGCNQMKRTDVCAQKRVKFNPSVVQFGEEGIEYLPLADCQVLDGVSLHSSNKSKEFMDLKDFRIIVDGVIIDSKIPDHVRVKYYELCHSQSALLHRDVLQNSSPMLIAGMICEIVNKANFIRACKLATPIDELEAARKTLMGIKQMGFNVDFLLTRLDKGIKLKLDFDSSEANKSYKEAMVKSRNAKLKMLNLRIKMLNIKNDSVRDMLKNA